MTRYVTPAMIAQHAKKTRLTVYRALKRAGIEGERFPGARGVRIPISIANKFLMRQWPEAAPLN